MNEKIKKITIVIVKIITVICVLIFAKYCSNFVSYPFYILLMLSILILLSLSNSILACLLLFINKKMIYSKYKKGEVTFEYFRDVVKNYPIGALSYCSGKKIDYKDQIISLLLKMNLEKKVELGKEFITIIEPSRLTWIEKEVVDEINDGNILSNRKLRKMIKKNNRYEFEHSSLSVSKSKNMDIISNLQIFGFFELFLCIIVYIYVLLIYGNININFLSTYAIIFGITLFSVFISFIYKKNYYNNFLSKTGYEVRKKLRGLKKFLNDFSNIETIDSIVIWDYYIIYAILFNQKGNLNKEASDLYKKYLKIYINATDKRLIIPLSIFIEFVILLSTYYIAAFLKLIIVDNKLLFILYFYILSIVFKLTYPKIYIISSKIVILIKYRNKKIDINDVSPSYVKYVLENLYFAMSRKVRKKYIKDDNVKYCDFMNREFFNEYVVNLLNRNDKFLISVSIIFWISFFVMPIFVICNNLQFNIMNILIYIASSGVYVLIVNALNYKFLNNCIFYINRKGYNDLINLYLLEKYIKKENLNITNSIYDEYKKVLY